MTNQQLVQDWFGKWETGDFENLPLTNDFTHTSPYGTIKGKQAYVQLVAANKEQFLGHRFEIHDELCGEHSACVRYTARQGDFSLQASEWFYFKEGLIASIVSYYNVDEKRVEEY